MESSPAFLLFLLDNGPAFNIPCILVRFGVFGYGNPQVALKRHAVPAWRIFCAQHDTSCLQLLPESQDWAYGEHSPPRYPAERHTDAMIDLNGSDLDVILREESPVIAAAVLENAKIASREVGGGDTIGDTISRLTGNA